MPKKNSRSPHALREHPLIVQSHLRWDFVWQRPQQLMSRFAKTAPVLFVEEPIYLDDTTRPVIDVQSVIPNVFRAIPRLPAAFRNEYDASIEEVRKLVVAKIGQGGSLDRKFRNAVQWFYTPMPAPAMLGAFNEIGVVYDCMDELAQFRGAPSGIRERENLLLANADVVFTGGYQLFKSKSAAHDNVHFFGCGVDVDHFGSARSENKKVPADVPARGPVAGYFGVIDERLDYGLIESLARQYPECSVVMVGPTAKVDPAELPSGPNIHWLGQRTYEELPGYVKGFDVCLMPFALNEATEYINPTKTLEYMAAGKPIVSTAVPDVVRNFTPIVRVARSPEEFVKCVIEAAANPDQDSISKGIEMARASSWESIVGRMRNLMSEAADTPDILGVATSATIAEPADAELPGA
jgi:glycosyltransferase involved in cell wall biosynthesis